MFLELMASKLYGVAKVRNTKKMHGAYSETWWWQCPYVGLHECCWCRGLHFIDGIMNSQMYCSILKEKMLPSLRALGRRALFPT